MTTMRTLVASINGQTVGHLTEDRDVWSFQYHEDWLASADRYEISPKLALRQEPFVDGSTTRPVQWFFDNLLPEGELRKLLADDARVSIDDAWGMLSYIGAESAGALTLLPSGAEPQPAGLVPLTDDALQRRIDALPHRSLSAESPKRMSLAGAQHKLPVSVANSGLFEPKGSESSTHILKPDSRNPSYPHSVINEYFCMRLADTVKLPVPEVSMRRVPAPVYLVTRFDRSHGNGAVQRIHTFDGAQLLSIQGGQKYSHATPHHLRQCLDNCRARVSARINLFRWVVFNILVGNSDAHLKNVSFMVGPAGIELAPFYDLLSTAVYHTSEYLLTHAPDEPAWPDVHLTMEIGDAKTFGEVRHKDVVAVGVALGLKSAAASKLITEMIEAVVREAGKLADELRSRGDLIAGERRVLDLIMNLPIKEIPKLIGR